DHYIYRFNSVADAMNSILSVMTGVFFGITSEGVSPKLQNRVARAWKYYSYINREKLGCAYKLVSGS
ncbi:MAG TPA: hypothetical protein VFM18_02840, partial [Methanosarcina sp.]|nr:hypothetical protein [Methanosarcina sp.]